MIGPIVKRGQLDRLDEGLCGREMRSMNNANLENMLHHLSKDVRGRWEIRVTIDQGRAFVGKPLRIKIGRCTEEEAIRRRDEHLKILRRAGVIVKLREQTRKPAPMKEQA